MNINNILILVGGCLITVFFCLIVVFSVLLHLNKKTRYLEKQNMKRKHELDVFRITSNTILKTLSDFEKECEMLYVRKEDDE